MSKERMGRDCRAAIRSGLDFLEDSQLENGCFSSVFAVASTGTIPDNLQQYGESLESCHIETDKLSLFPSLLIGSSLTYAASCQRTQAILRGIATYIESNRGRFGIWQHFTPGHQLYPFNPFDVDDTVMASLFLRKIGRKVPRNEGAVLANANSAGLIYTWFAFRRDINFHPVYLYYCLRELKHPIKSFFYWRAVEAARDDVDAVVNANVLSYLGLRKETEPIARHLIDIIVAQGEADCDKWYRNIFTVYYFFSRALGSILPKYSHPRDIITSRLLDSLASTRGSELATPLEAALAVCTLCNLDSYDDIPSEAIQYLLSCQNEIGSWDKHVFYYGGPEKKAGWGGEEISTAICVEALSRYEQCRGET